MLTPKFTVVWKKSYHQSDTPPVRSVQYRLRTGSKHTDLASLPIYWRLTWGTHRFIQMLQSLSLVILAKSY